MKAIIKQHKISILITLVAIIASAIYCLAVPRRYMATGSILLYRSQIGHPEMSQEDLSNRWVWIRDGLSTKEILNSDDNLLTIYKKEPLLQKRFEKLSKPSDKTATITPQAKENSLLIFLSKIKTNVKIDYSGGDVYSFIFSVTDENPELAKNMVNDFFGIFRTVVVNQLDYSYQGALETVTTRIKALKKEEYNLPKTPQGKERAALIGDEIDYLQGTYNKLDSARLLFQGEIENRIKVLSKPFVPEDPEWPKTGFILLAGCILGLFFGLFAEYVLILVRDGQKKSKTNSQF